ncbi:MAG: hypothetical protein QXD34_00225 [Candidatus Bathyarchaeia archaeon]|nr:hypothetical protein [Candidatus Bathyarchaeota archaeon]
MSTEEHYGFILISDANWWEKLCQRTKSNQSFHTFVRRSLVGPVYTEKLLFYVKRPFMQIRGIADFVERAAGNADELWKKYGGETCLGSFEDYIQFLKGRKNATFIRFTNFQELKVPISTEAMKKVLSISRIPRGGKYISHKALKQLLVKNGAV